VSDLRCTRCESYHDPMPCHSGELAYYIPPVAEVRELFKSAALLTKTQDRG
jgi:hypothetical protein